MYQLLSPQAAGAVKPDSAPKSPIIPPIGKDAAAVLQDSLSTLPERAERWLTVAAGAFVRFLPRLVLAVLAAALVIALTVWLHRL